MTAKRNAAASSNELAEAARRVLSDLRALLTRTRHEALVPAYRALEHAQRALDDEANRLHAAVRVEPTDADHERVVAEVRDVLARAPERKPAAGWGEIRPGSWAFAVMGCTLQAVYACDGSWIWMQRGRYQRANSAERGIAPTLIAAQLAAEDVLRAIAEKILRAVGK